jgi:hypothetical protein
MNQTVQWSATPPSNTGFQAHKFSFLDIVERASEVLHTDLTKDQEYLVAGSYVARLVVTLPQFRVEGGGTLKTLPKMNVNGHKNVVAKIGEVGGLVNRAVYLDRDMPWDEAELINSNVDRIQDQPDNVDRLRQKFSRVTIKVTDVPEADKKYFNQGSKAEGVKVEAAPA